MKKIVALASVGALAVNSFAAGHYAATDSVTSALTNLGSDVNSEIAPVAIVLVCAVCAVVVGRALIKKFFKI